MSGLNVFVPITKIDAAKRLVYGVATAEQPDRAGEVCDYESTKPHYQKWSGDIAKASDGKSLGNLRAMHGKVAAGKVTDIAFNDSAKQVEICAKVVDDTEWKKVEEGVYTGFSQGGAYEKRWTDPENPGLTRYTAIPSEISLVDLPCLPGATFSFVKTDGSTELRKFHEPAPAAAKEPTNAEIAEKATELAKAAGNETKWVEHLDAARAELMKAAAPVDKGPNTNAEPVAEAVKTAGSGDMADLGAKPETPVNSDGVEQVWKAKDGSTFAKKADAIAHNAHLDAQAAAKAVAGPAEAALAALEAKFGKGTEQDAKAITAANEGEKIAEALKAARGEFQKALAGAFEGDDLAKYIGEEAWDAAQAIQAVNSIFSLLVGEMGEAEDHPEQIAALRAAIASLKDFIVSEIQEDNDPDAAMERAVAALDLAKKGARNSAKDASRIQAVHDHSCGLGAKCNKDNCGDDAEKAMAADQMAKVVAEKDALKAQIEALTKRVEEIAAMPMRPYWAPGTQPIDKAADNGQGQLSPVEQDFVKLPPDEQAKVLFKLAQQQGKPILARGTSQG